MLKKIALYALIIGGVLLFSACNEPEPIPPTPDLPPVAEAEERLPILEETELTDAQVYYATADGQHLLPLNININATKEVARLAMEKLLAGPPNSFAAAVLPSDTKLIDLYSSKTTVYVDLTAEILTIEAEKAQLAVDAIAHTVLPLAEGFNLQILVEGQEIASLNGVDISEPLHLSYVNLDSLSRAWREANSEQAPGAVLTYYLPDPFAMYLVPQSRLFYATMINTDGEADADADGETDADAETEVDVDTDATAEASDQQGAAADLSEDGQAAASAPDLNQQYAVAIVDALLNVDPQSGLSTPFWPGTTLNSLTIIDNIAHVDLGGEVLGYSGGSTFEIMMVDSLVASLTRLPEVQAVQILINGRIIENLPEGLDISRPLTGGQLLNLVK